MIYEHDDGVFVDYGSPFGKEGYIVTVGERQIDGMSACRTIGAIDGMIRTLNEARESIRSHAMKGGK